MVKRVTGVLMYGGLALVFVGCATKGFVREQVGSAETRVGQQIEGQGAALRDTSARLDSKIEGVDGRVGEVRTLATDAKRGADDAKRSADDVSAAVREVDSRTTQRFANRNRFTVLDTKSVIFDFGKSDLRDESVNMIREIAAALKQDPNAVLELQGQTDGVGTDRFNLQLSRERVDAVVRYLVQKEGIDLRRISTVGFGKEIPVADNGSKDGRSKNRRVDIRILTTPS